MHHYPIYNLRYTVVSRHDFLFFGFFVLPFGASRRYRPFCFHWWSSRSSTCILSAHAHTRVVYFQHNKKQTLKTSSRFCFFIAVVREGRPQQRTYRGRFVVGYPLAIESPDLKTGTISGRKNPLKTIERNIQNRPCRREKLNRNPAGTVEEPVFRKSRFSKRMCPLHYACHLAFRRFTAPVRPKRFTWFSSLGFLFFDA